MGVVSLVDNRRRTRFFRKIVLCNLEYWLAWLDEVKERDIEDLDSERSNIVKAILFALDLGKLAWPLTQQLLTTFSSYMERRGQWETWSKILSRAIELAAKMEDTAGIATLSALLARVLFWQSRFRESTTSYRIAIKAARQIGNRFVEAQAYSNLGYYYVEHGFWYRAEVLCCRALSLFEQIDSDHGRAHTENHLGILYIWQGSWAKAQSHLKRACAIWQQMDDNNGLMYGLTNLGLLFVETNQPEEALFYLKKALHWAQATGETYQIGNIYINIGLAYNLQDNFEAAETFSREAEAIFQQHSNLLGRTHAMENLGIIYQAQQDWPQTIIYLERALAGWRTLNKKQGILQTIVRLAKCELAGGNRPQANIWINEGKQLLNQYPQSRRYYELSEQLEMISRNLLENVS
jgi:tetratricopeptide (TPR) repeat protein